MSIVNRIAAFGQNAGAGITSGLNEARRRYESDRSHNSIQQRYDLQDKLYNNELARMEQQQSQAAQDAERQYAADGVKAIYSAPPEYRDQVYQGWMQGAQQRGYDVAGAPPEYSDEVLYKLAGSVGANLKPDSSQAPANIQEWNVYQQMTPEQQAQFLNMKRASKTLNLGGSQVVLDHAGDVSKRYQVTPKPQDMPEFGAAVETAKLEAQGQLKPKIEGDIAREKKQAQFDVDKAGKQPKALAALKQAETKWDIVDRKIDEALQDVSGWTAGIGGVFLSKIPGTEATDLKNTLDTIRANIGFDELQQMRDNSPTGGALGQVSEMENRLLQAVKGSTQQEQTPAQLKQNLEEIKTWLQSLREAKREAYNNDFGGAVSGPSIDSLVDKYAD